MKNNKIYAELTLWERIKEDLKTSHKFIFKMYKKFYRKFRNYKLNKDQRIYFPDEIEMKGGKNE